MTHLSETAGKSLGLLSVPSSSLFDVARFLMTCIFQGVKDAVVSNSLRPDGLYSPWNSPGQNTGVGSFSLLQRIFPTQGSNPGLPHCRQILYQLSNKGNPPVTKIYKTFVRISKSLSSYRKKSS